MSLKYSADEGRAARHVRPPSKRARLNSMKHLAPIASSTHGKNGGASVGCLSVGSTDYAGSSRFAKGLGAAGGKKRSKSLADQIYDLSSEVGVLRSRSADIVRALRSTAQGVHELEDAFRPLLVALESGLAECHQADLEAIFGRSAVPRGVLGCPPTAGNRDVCSSEFGGTAAAVERLDHLISALYRDVAAAGMLADQGERLREIARWARRAISSTTPQPPPTSGARKSEVTTDHATLHRRDACAPRNSDVIGEPRSALGGGGQWTLRVFQDNDPGPERFGKIESDVLFRSHDRSVHINAGQSNTHTFNNRSIGSSRRGRKRGGCPIVAVQALRAALSTVDPPATEAPATLPLREGGVEGGASAPSYSLVKSVAGAWSFPFSWLIGSSGRNSGETKVAPLETPSLPRPPPPSVLPRVIVRVIYVGRVSDMARLARTEGRASAAEGKNRATDCASTPRESSEYDMFAHLTPVPAHNVTGDDGAGPVELVRSEVRFVVASPGTQSSLQGVRANLQAEPKEGSRLPPRTAVKLQVVLQLRTRSPVAVVRLVHRGGHLMPERLSTEAVPSTILQRPVPARFSASPLPSFSTRAQSSNPVNGYSTDSSGGADGVDGRGRSHEAGMSASFDTSMGQSDHYVLGVGDHGITGNGRGGHISSICDEDADDDMVIPGFTNPPDELLLPRGYDTGGCELKFGTEHFLGLNVVLPLDQLHPSGDGARTRIRRRPRTNPPSHQRQLRGNSHKAHGANQDAGDFQDSRGKTRPDDSSSSDKERCPSLVAAGGHGRGWKTNSKKRPRSNDWIDDDALSEGMSVRQSADGDFTNVRDPLRERDRGGGGGVGGRVPQRQGRPSDAVDPLDAYSGQDGGYDGCELSKVAKRKIGNKSKKTGWGWGVFRLWRGEPNGGLNSSTGSSPPFQSKQQQSLRIEQDIKRLLESEEERGVQARGSSFRTFGSNIDSDDIGISVSPLRPREAGATNKSSADPGVEPLRESEPPGSGSLPLLKRKNAPLIVTVVVAPPAASTLS